MTKLTGWYTAEKRHNYDQVIRAYAENAPVALVCLAGWDAKSSARHAAMIAAAPDMLAALRCCLGELLPFNEDGDQPGIQAAIDAARAAIAKATQS